MIQRTIASDVAFGGRPEPQRTKLLGFKPFVRSTLRGFVDVELGIGLQIKGATLHVTTGKSWIGLPSRPMVGPDGKPIVIEATGKPPYQPILAGATRRFPKPSPMRSRSSSSSSTPMLSTEATNE
jgi:hypothetical protein